MIAYAGARTLEDFLEIFEQTKAIGALAASIFHFGDISIPDFKNEAADLLYHILILLKAKDINLEKIEEVLKMRSK